ncbi:MAG: L-seryl-tRNA(Sec) selenium transferase [Frankiales bacterium]|nr:L-seryl-tRNA(Sec) selenium transferase [Frankiales bacterium]
MPRTDAVLADERLVAASEIVGPHAVKDVVRRMQERVRTGALHPDDVADAAAAALPASSTTMRRVINATGIVLHTNLGRAALSPAATDALAQAAGYVDVEFDLETGQRARRGRGALDALRTAVPEAGDVHVVTNGAAALVLAATALAQGKDIVVSRGEMVEIGDGFRLPDLLVSTGARLREVGTTNRTTADDYAAAVGVDTAFVLKVHPSNFRIEGFTSAASVADLAALGVPVVVDIGSGLLSPDTTLPAEPDARTALRAGAALVTASGDKLLGGPQAGLLLGGAALIERLRRHPLARALRVDKLTLAALEATLRGPVGPTASAVHAAPAELKRRADAMAARLTDAALDVRVVPSDGAVGGGGAPGVALAGWAVALPEPYTARLRRARPPIIARTEKGRCLLDLRCVSPADDDTVVAAVLAAAVDDGQ